MKDIVREMLDRINASATEEREPTIKIDKDVMPIIRKRWIGSIRSTVNMLCKIADDALSKAEKNSEQPHIDSHHK